MKPMARPVSGSAGEGSAASDTVATVGGGEASASSGLGSGMIAIRVRFFRASGVGNEDRRSGRGPSTRIHTARREVTS
jgi:hypothetical protein